MYVLTYYNRQDRNCFAPVIETVCSPKLSRLLTIADALRATGYAVRIWCGNKLVWTDSMGPQVRTQWRIL